MGWSRGGLLQEREAGQSEMVGVMEEIMGC